MAKKDKIPGTLKDAEKGGTASGWETDPLIQKFKEFLKGSDEKKKPKKVSSIKDLKARKAERDMA